MISFQSLWKDYFATFFKENKKLYILYIILILVFYFLQTLVLPKIISMYSKIPEKGWFSENVVKKFWPLLGIIGVLIVFIFVKNRIDAVLPTMHYKWLRKKMFNDMIWAYREKNSGVSVGVFMMRYNLLPQEIRFLFEDVLETIPVGVSLCYLFLYFFTFDIKIASVFLLLYVILFLYIIYSPYSKKCQDMMVQRAQENLNVNDSASQEVLNLHHIYANQVEDEHIRDQSRSEDVLQNKWEKAQKCVTNLLFQINLFGWIIFGVILTMFYNYFRKHPDKKTLWPAVLIILTFTQSSLLNTMPRWVGLFNGFTMIKVYHNSIMSNNTEQEKTSEGSKVFQGNDVCDIDMKNIHLQYGEKVIFDRFDGHIGQGKKILIQGASGSGKSSLFHMLTRYTTDYTGTITIGGTDIREWDVHALREKIITTPQQTQLFDKSIFYNICVDECSETQKEELLSIIRRYNWDKILGKNLEKRCGVMGKDVSHGMQKLIILLRLMWKSMNARVILVDEPLASLDQQTQEQVLEFLLHMSKDKTLLINNHVPLSRKQYELFDDVWDSSSFRAA